MSEYIIQVESDVVGHIAKAIDPDGVLLATANGFGAKDARRKLRAKMEGITLDRTVVKTTKKSRKIHNPAGVIFAAKNNIEKYKGKKAK